MQINEVTPDLLEQEMRKQFNKNQVLSETDEDEKARQERIKKEMGKKPEFLWG